MKTIKKWRRNAPWWRRASCHSYWLERPAVLCVEETRRPFAGWSSPPQWVAAASAGSHARLENSRWARRSPLKTPHNDELSTKHIDTTVTSRFSLPCQWISYIPISAWTNKKTSSRKKSPVQNNLGEFYARIATSAGMTKLHREELPILWLWHYGCQARVPVVPPLQKCPFPLRNLHEG